MERSTETGPIGVLVALKEELRAIEPGLRSKRVVIARTGIGKESAGRKAALFLDSARPALLLACGFAGGLRPGLTAGDILIAHSVGERGVPDEWSAPPELAEAARRAGSGLEGHAVKMGKLLTVEKVVSTATGKLGLGKETRADAVDMESSAVLRAAGERRIPTLCVRVILDDVDFDLPFDFGRILTPEGRPRFIGALREVAEHPAGLVQLFPLRARARAAAAALATFLPRLVEELGR